MNKYKIFQNIFLLISIVCGSFGFFTLIQFVLIYGPQKPTNNTRTIEVPYSHHEIVLLEEEINGSTSLTPGESVKPTPTALWMSYDGIDLNGKEIETLFQMNCIPDVVQLAPFLVIPYEPDIFTTSTFFQSLDFAIAWEHLGYHGFWIHSGYSKSVGDLPAYPLQLYLENDQHGNKRNQRDFFLHLENCFIGSVMFIRQNETVSLSRIVAAVRIPPDQVVESSVHVNDLVPYLAAQYPGSGFEKMTPPGLLFNFCGRQLRGERHNPDLEYWSQSRIIFGAVPLGYAETILYISP